MQDLIGSALGWIGTVGTLTAYILLMRGRLTAETMRYSFLNVIGGLLAAGGAFAYGAWPAVASNILWASFGLHSVIMGLRKRREIRRNASAATAEATLWTMAPWHPESTLAAPISLPWLEERSHCVAKEPVASTSTIACIPV